MRRNSKTFLGRLVINMFALVITAAILPGIYISGILALVLAALVMGFVNTIIRPIFIFLTLPITILTLGLFLFVANGLMLMLTSALIPGFWIAGLWTAILGAIIISILVWVVNRIIY